MEGCHQDTREADGLRTTVNDMLVGEEVERTTNTGREEGIGVAGRRHKRRG